MNRDRPIHDLPGRIVFVEHLEPVMARRMIDERDGSILGNRQRGEGRDVAVDPGTVETSAHVEDRQIEPELGDRSAAVDMTPP